MAHQQRLRGAWKGDTAGGCSNFPSAKKNPQYIVQVTQRTHVDVTLTQFPDDAEEIQFAIGGMLVDKKGARVDLITASDRVVSLGDYSFLKEITFGADLDVAPDGYTLLVTTFNPGEECDFTVVISSDHPVIVTELPAFVDPRSKLGHKTSVSAEWKGRTAGGCYNHPTVANNPQFTVAVTKPTHAMFALTQTLADFESTPLAIGCTLADVGGTRIKVLSAKQRVAATSHFVGMEEVSFEADLVPGTVYTLLPSTFAPGEEAPFTISVYSTQPVAITEIPIEPSRDEIYPNKLVLQSAWKGPTAGGCLNFATAVNNPQFGILVNTKTKVLVALEQDRARGEEHFIGATVAYKGGERIKYVLRDEERASTGHFVNSKEVTLEAVLDPRPSPYTLFVSCFEAEAEAAFTVTIWSAEPVTASLLAQMEEVKKLPHNQEISGEWRGQSAGGCLNYPTAVNNPQYLLTIKEPTLVSITLAQRGATNRVPLGVSVMYCNGGRVTRRRADIVGTSGPFVELQEVNVELTLEPRPQPYSILPTTFQPGQERAFVLTVASSQPVGLAPLTGGRGSTMEPGEAEADAEEAESDDETPTIDSATTGTDVGTIEDANEVKTEFVPGPEDASAAGASGAAPEQPSSPVAKSGAAMPATPKPGDGPTKGRFLLLTPRDHAIAELLTSEEVYVNQLNELLVNCIMPLRQKIEGEPLLLTPEEHNSIFGYIENITIFNKDMFLAGLSACYDKPEIDNIALSPVFNKFLRPMRKFYTTYVSHYAMCLTALSKCLDGNVKFKEFHDKFRDSRLDISSYLITPVQRVPRYVLLVKEIVKHTNAETFNDYEALVKAFKDIEAVAAEINEAIRAAETAKKMFEIQTRFQGPSLSIGVPGRVFIREGPVMLAKNGKKKQKAIIFLFSDAMMHCAPKTPAPAMAYVEIRPLAGAKVNQPRDENRTDWDLEFHDKTTWTIYAIDTDQKLGWMKQTAAAVRVLPAPAPVSNRMSMAMSSDSGKAPVRRDGSRSSLASLPRQSSQSKGSPMGDAAAAEGDASPAAAEASGSGAASPAAGAGGAGAAAAVPLSKTGWLTKMGEKNKSWKRRWCVLENGQLSYYEKEKAKTPKGVIEMAGYEVGPDDVATAKDGKAHFTMVQGGMRTWFFYADTLEERSDWMATLTAVARAE